MDKNITQLFWEVPIIFVFLLVLTRIQGKRQISQLTYFDYITGITLGDVASGTLVDETIPLSRTLAALALLGGLSILASYITTKSRKIRKIAEGEPIIVIKEGKLLEQNMKRLRLDIDNLRMLLREKNVFTMADVEYAIMETDGAISLLKKAEKENVTRKDMAIKTQKVKPSTEIIVDGVLDKSKLKELNLSEEWLHQTLSQNGFEDIKDVSYMELDGNGKVYFDHDEDGFNQIH